LSVRVEDNEIFVEFSLTLPKRAWKTRKLKKKRKPTPKLGYVIERGDIFEWMITNEEVRDILSTLKCISRKNYDEIRSLVYGLAEYIDWSKEIVVRDELSYGIFVEASLQPKMRKRTELTPYLFVLFPLDHPSEAHYLIDKKGRRVDRTLRYKIRAGDKLVWLIEDIDWIRIIVSRLATLSEAHNRRIKEEVFEIIDSLNPLPSYYKSPKPSDKGQPS